LEGRPFEDFQEATDGKEGSCSWVGGDTWEQESYVRAKKRPPSMGRTREDSRQKELGGVLPFEGTARAKRANATVGDGGAKRKERQTLLLLSGC
jgi:hypothetical protein